MRPNMHEYCLQVREDVIKYFRFDIMKTQYGLCSFDTACTTREALLHDIMYFIEIKASALGVSHGSIATEIYNLFCSTEPEKTRTEALQRISGHDDRAIVLSIYMSLHCFVEPLRD